ncbi:putative T7SS-secreted protein [Plantibacter sp. Mn2098]|uniref:putative T7SS-secreted protein n=1 Tax=Plantibacter sp. Mn2098 TaxID=3395266 RepID=UPI003BDFFE1A
MTGWWGGAPGLADTLAPDALLPGDLGAIDRGLEAFEQTMQECSAVAEALGRITVGEWTGPAADDFRTEFSGMPQAWVDASAAMARAHTTLDDYRSAFNRCRATVDEAIGRWKQGEWLTEQAMVDHQAQHQCAVDANPAAFIGAIIPVLPFDPGARARAEAEADLESARRYLVVAGDDAAEAIRAWAASAPEQPFWEGFWDVAGKVAVFPGEFVEGFLLSGWDTLAGVWEFSPVSHLIRLVAEGPAAEWEHLQEVGSGFAATAGALASDPFGTAGAIVDELFGLYDWSEHPGRVVGRFAFSGAGLLAGGGGLAGTAGSGAGRLGPIAGATARGLDDIPKIPAPIPVTGTLPIDRIERLFAKGDAAAPLSVGGKEVLSTPNKTGSTRLYDTADIPDAELATEARRIATEFAGGKELTPTSDPQVWNVKLDDGSKVNLRSKSTSGVSRWTIDIINHDFTSQGFPKNRLEIKLE